MGRVRATGSAFLPREHRTGYEPSVPPSHEPSTLHGRYGLVGTSAD